MASQKVTVVKGADGKSTATCEDAVLMDVLTTAVSSDQTLTGSYGFGQKVGFVALGMMIQEYRRSGSLNPL